MPMYTYRCPECGVSDSKFRKIVNRDVLPYCLDCLKEKWASDIRMQRIIEAPMVAPDIGAYQAVAVDVATGKAPVINSRSSHREFLKRNGYQEVGNERIGRKPGEVRGDFNLRKELTQATREVLGKRK
jgi:hypothetical protein